MSSRRTLILIAAIVVGAIAAFALYQYVGGVEDRANEDARLVRVLVVKQDIPRGLTGQEAQLNEYIVSDEINAKYKPVTAVNDLSTISTKVAVTRLAAGQVLVEGMFADPIESQITAARRIPTGMVAVSFSIDEVRAVSGLLVPGDFVNVMIQGPNPDPQCADGSIEDQTASGIYCGAYRYLYQELQILFIGRSPIPLPGEQASGGGGAGLMTVAVPPDVAQVIAAQAGNFYFTLLPSDYTPVPLPPVEVFPNLPGEDPNRLTPYGPTGLQDQ